MISVNDVSGLILAGGQGRRMQEAGHVQAAGSRSGHSVSENQDARTPVEKGLMLLHGAPLVSWAAGAMPDGLAELYISANRHHGDYADFGLVVPDDPSFGVDIGPLAGVLAVLQRMSTHWLYVTPVDVPSPPRHVFQNLAQHAQTKNVDLVYACTERPQPLFMLLNKNMLDSLQDYVRRGFRQVQRWQQKRGEAVCFDATDDRFFNINTPADLMRAHQLIRSHGR